MTRITVLNPEYEEIELGSGVLAPRGAPTTPVVLTLIDNGKPKAREILLAIAAEVGRSVPLLRVDVHSKPSAAAPIDADTARMLAARSHLVVTGVGD